MHIQEAIVHHIGKSANSDVVTETPRTVISPIDAVMSKLAEEVLGLYGKVSNMYGTFDPDPVYQFESNLSTYIDSTHSFIDFSTQATHLIAIAMKDSLFSTGGYALFIRYQNQGREWLLIVMLKLKSQTGIDQNTLDLNQSLVFDIKHLNEAVRIDLQKWSIDDQPYLSFIKRGNADDQVTRYFRRALGCTDYTDSKKNTEQALKAVDAYCQSINASPEQKQVARRKIFEYCDEKRKANEPVNLIALSAILFDQTPDAFFDFIKSNNYSINDTFAPHRATYIRFHRIRGRVGSVQLSFDVEDLINGVVRYDSVANNIIVTNIPTGLSEEITSAHGSNATAN